MSESRSHPDGPRPDDDEGRQVWLTPPESMQHSLVIAAGVLATVIASYVGLVAIPNWQVNRLEPVKLENGETYPAERSELAQKGKDVYIDLGCVYCHSQQVRQNDFGGDLSRGWGMRSSVPLDYTREETPVLGTMRTGPDLRNIGGRQPSRQWHYLHLYNPRITSPGSTMPPFRFLFDTVPIEGRTNVPVGRVDMPEEHSVPGHYVVATDRARALVEYLLSLDHDQTLPENANRGTDPEQVDP
jgi:cytochrome c oxidase cbb3-type subunit 2